MSFSPGPQPTACAVRFASDRSCAHADRVAEEPAEPHPAAAHDVSVPLDGRKPPHEPADRHLPLHAGQPHAGAGVDAGGERQVPVGMPPDVEAERLGGQGRIAVGTPDDAGDEGDRTPQDPSHYGYPTGPAIAELVRAFEPEDLLD